MSRRCGDDDTKYAAKYMCLYVYVYTYMYIYMYMHIYDTVRVCTYIKCFGTNLYAIVCMCVHMYMQICHRTPYIKCDHVHKNSEYIRTSTQLGDNAMLVRIHIQMYSPSEQYKNPLNTCMHTQVDESGKVVGGPSSSSSSSRSTRTGSSSSSYAKRRDGDEAVSYTYMYVCVCIYIYIYIIRKATRWR